MATKTVPYISASQINKFSYCPLLFKNDYIDGGVRMPPNIYMVYGTAVHKALEFNFRQKMKTRVDLDPNIVAEKFKEFFYAEVSANSLTQDRIFQLMVHQGQHSVIQYIKEIAPDLMPKAVELEFNIKLENFPITIKGFIDLITEDGRIIDYKTAGKAWKSQYRQTTVDKNIQLTLYAAAYRKLFKQAEISVEFHILPRPERLIAIRKSSRANPEIIKLLQTASTIEKIVELGVFVPNLSKCSGCDMRHSCPKVPWVEEAGGFLYLTS